MSKVVVELCRKTDSRRRANDSRLAHTVYTVVGDHEKTKIDTHPLHEAAERSHRIEVPSIHWPGESIWSSSYGIVRSHDYNAMRQAHFGHTPTGQITEQKKGQETLVAYINLDDGAELERPSVPPARAGREMLDQLYRPSLGLSCCRFPLQDSSKCLPGCLACLLAWRR